MSEDPGPTADPTAPAGDQWAGKTAVVTGVAGPMGRHIVEQLLARGVQVAGIDLSVPLEASGLRHERFLPLPADLSQRSDIATAFEMVDARWSGGVDMLVNLAGIASSTNGIADISEEEFERVIGVNLAGTVWTCQEAVRRMIARQRAGSIVNISSINAFRGRAQFPTHIYAASKAGVIGLSRSLAAELGAHGIRVNCIAPGLHATPMATSTAGGPEATRAFLESAKAGTPLNRIAEPTEMAGPVLFLLGSDSRNITGQVISSDGGRSTWYR